MARRGSQQTPLSVVSVGLLSPEQDHSHPARCSSWDIFSQGGHSRIKVVWLLHIP